MMTHDEMIAVAVKAEPVARMLGISAERPLKPFTGLAPAQRRIDSLVSAQ